MFTHETALCNAETFVFLSHIADWVSIQMSLETGRCIFQYKCDPSLASYRMKVLQEMTHLPERVNTNWRRQHERNKVYSEVLADRGARIILQLLQLERRICKIVILDYVHRLIIKF
jgi:hypothetical protein